MNTPTPKRRRAREADGQFRGDDPATTVNEAWEQPDAQPTNAENAEAAQFAADLVASQAATNTAQKQGTVVYVTKDKTTSTFDILVAGDVIRGGWDTKRERVILRVPAALVERFEMHTLYQDGRIIKA